MIGILYKERYIYVHLHGGKKTVDLAAPEKDARVLAMAVSVGRLFQSSVTWGDKDILRWSVLQYGVGVLEWLVMSWVSFWLAWSAGAVAVILLTMIAAWTVYLLSRLPMFTSIK